MRMKFSATAFFLTLLLSGCSTGDELASGDPVAQTASIPSSPSSPSPTSDLGLPKKATYLVPVTSGTKSAELKQFTPTEGVYTVHIKCTGEGEVSIEYKGNPERTKIKCNGLLTVGQVYADVEKQYVSIRSDGADMRWSVAILSGAPEGNGMG